jgi:uncharacterized protein (DUF849 family)
MDAKLSKPSTTRTLQVALNGDSTHPAMPRSPHQIAVDAAECVAAGATLLHLHAFDDDGQETLAEAEVSRTIRAVRAQCPGIPISMTTFAQIEPDPGRRLETITRWSELPELVPANQGEEGIDELTDLLLARGVGVEACVFTSADAGKLLRRGGVDRFRRIVVEPIESDPSIACAHALEIEEMLLHARVALEQVHHGVGRSSWPVLRQAALRGHGVRTGLEDVSELPDGRLAASTVDLVQAAVALAFPI